MTEPVEFGSFYQLLKSVKQGSEERIKELEWMLAEYEHAKESKGAYDELGQIFCHHGIMELYEYTGLEDIQIISGFNNSVWDYLKLRTNSSLPDYMVTSMVNHAQKHKLTSKIAKKWEFDEEQLSDNLADLASYLSEGIADVVINN